MWQAVQDVGVQAADSARAESFRHVAGQSIALLASDGFLDQRVEVLHPDRCAVHARCGERVKAGIVDLVRINLD